MLEEQTAVIDIPYAIDDLPRPSKRLRRFQTTSLALLVMSGMINMMDRSTLSVANPLIRHDLGISVGQMGLLLSSFLWAYAFCQLPIGFLVDRVGPRLLLGCAQIVWSVAQLLCGFAGGFGEFCALRMLLGAGESPQFPISASVVRACFSPQDRGLPTGVFLLASSIGPAISAPLITLIMMAFGWRPMFAIMGITGILAAVIWLAFYRAPSQLGFNASDNRYLNQAAQKPKAVTAAEWRMLFSHRTTWGMILGFFGTIYLIWLYTAWLPGYLEIQRHMTIPHTGLIAAIPFFGGTLGSLTGGFLIDKIASARRLSPLAACKLPAVIGLTGMALFTAVAAEVTSNDLAIACMTAALFLGFLAMSGQWAMVSVGAPENCVGSLGGIMNFGGYLGGALAPMFTGFIVQSTHSFVPALLTAAAIGVSAAMLCLLLVNKPLPTGLIATPL
jgi:MFS family permease